MAWGWRTRDAVSDHNEEIPLFTPGADCPSYSLLAVPSESHQNSVLGSRVYQTMSHSFLRSPTTREEQVRPSSEGPRKEARKVQSSPIEVESILYYTILYYTILCYTLPYSTLLTILYCIMLYQKVGRTTQVPRSAPAPGRSRGGSASLEGSTHVDRSPLLVAYAGGPAAAQRMEPLQQWRSKASGFRRPSKTSQKWALQIFGLQTYRYKSASPTQNNRKTWKPEFQQGDDRILCSRLGPLREP